MDEGMEKILVQYDHIIDVLYHLEVRLTKQATAIDDLLDRYDMMLNKVDEILKRGI